MMRWILVPITFALLGLGVGVGADLGALLLTAELRSLDWRVLLSLFGACAIVTYPISAAFLGFESVAVRSPHESPHLRQMWIVYPLWLFSTLAFAGSHGTILLAAPFATLSGVLLGNLAANLRAHRASPASTSQ